MIEPSTHVIKEIMHLLYKTSQPCNPYHALNITKKYNESEIRDALNQLVEKGYIQETRYPKGGYSVKMTDYGRNKYSDFSID